MAAPHAPIIVLHEGDDAVGAFFTTAEAVEHLSNDHRVEGDKLAEWSFFDARGRRLQPSVGSDGILEDLAVAGGEDQSALVRERVRKRARKARDVLDRARENIDRVDDSALTLADDDVAFEVFAWRLASALRDEPTGSDPVWKPGAQRPWDSGGWWHNTFSH